MVLWTITEKVSWEPTTNGEEVLESRPRTDTRSVGNPPPAGRCWHCWTNHSKHIARSGMRRVEERALYHNIGDTCLSSDISGYLNSNPGSGDDIEHRCSRVNSSNPQRPGPLPTADYRPSEGSYTCTGYAKLHSSSQCTETNGLRAGE